MSRLFALFILTTFIFEVNSQCSTIINGTCYINGNSSSNTMQCGSNICIISCSSKFACSFKHIICPLNALKCVINCNTEQSCEETNITATSTKHTEINIAGSNSASKMTINAPGSNGQLYVNVSTDADFYGNTIQSQPMSNGIHINCNAAHLCINNTINGYNMHQSLMFLCNGANVDCSNSNIFCPLYTDSCNIDCSSCQYMNVYTRNRLSDINWQCVNESTSCIYSKLHCDEYSTDLTFIPSQSQWLYDANICEIYSTSTFTAIEATIAAKVPTGNPTMEPAILKTTGNINDNEIDFEWNNIIAENHLYAIGIIVILLLLCIKCIIMFWLYSQNRIEIQIIQNKNKIIEMAEREMLKTHIRRQSLSKIIDINDSSNPRRVTVKLPPPPPKINNININQHENNKNIEKPFVNLKHEQRKITISRQIETLPLSISSTHSPNEKSLSMQVNASPVNRNKFEYKYQSVDSLQLENYSETQTFEQLQKHYLNVPIKNNNNMNDQRRNGVTISVKTGNQNELSINMYESDNTTNCSDSENIRIPISITETDRRKYSD